MNGTRLPGRRWRRALLAPVLAVVTALAWSSPAAATGLVRISEDPYAGADDCQHASEVEPDTFAYGQTIVSAFQVGRCFNGGATNIGWATSTDGGSTWTHGYLPGITLAGGGIYNRATDPSVAYDPVRKVWMVSSLAIFVVGTGTQVPEIVLNRSSDGINWDPPVTLYHIAPGEDLDKNWTRCDVWPTSPYFGNCYTEFDVTTGGDLIRMTTSRDGGLTWSAPVSPVGNPRGLGGEPQPQPNGNVVVPSSNANETAVIAFRSLDGGETWRDVVTVSNIQARSTPSGLRAPPLPSATTARDGTIYVAWHDCRFQGATCTSILNPRAHDIVMTSSGDGVSWSALTRIPLDPVGSSVDHLLPGLGADRNTGGASTTLAFVYYFYSNYPCSASTCEMHAGFAYSADAGESWANRELTEVPMSLLWAANTTQGRMVGDYFMTAFTDEGEPHPVYAIAHYPQNLPFDEAMYTGGSVNLPHYSHTAERQPRSTAPVRNGAAAPATAR